MQEVKVELYKWEGKFWPFEIKTHCGECSLNKKVILKAIEEFGDEAQYIEFVELPWLNNWIKVLFKGAWHAPIVIINGKVIGQEKVLSKERIKDEIMKKLYVNTKLPQNGVHVYTIHNCPFCKKAKEILKKNNIPYTEHNVIDNSSDMMKLLSVITGKIHPITMPQIFINGTWVKGATDLEELEKSGKLFDMIK